MIADLKPNHWQNTQMTPDRAFTLAELVVYRYRDLIESQERKHAAQEIADLIAELALAWRDAGQ